MEENRQTERQTDSESDRQTIDGTQTSSGENKTSQLKKLPWKWIIVLNAT